MIVCGVKTTFNPNDDDKPHVDEVLPIAGNFATSTGTYLDPKIERLEDIPGSDMTGLRLELHGGTYMKQKQVAIVDLQCDPERTGNEKNPVKKGKDDEDDKVRNAESDGGNGSGDDDDDDSNSLRFVSYEKEEDNQVLRLDWRTKYACTTYEEDDDSDSGSRKDGTSKHWGFFTWFIILYVFDVFKPHTFESDADLSLQPLPRHSRLPDLRILAQLQPLRCTGLGPPSPRRHHQGYSVSVQRLVEKSGRYRVRRRK